MLHLKISNGFPFQLYLYPKIIRKYCQKQAPMPVCFVLSGALHTTTEKPLCQ